MKQIRTLVAVVLATLGIGGVVASPALALPGFSVSSTVRADTSVSFLATFDGGSAYYSRSYSWWYNGVKFAGGTAYRSYVTQPGFFGPGCHEVRGDIHYRLGLRGTGTQSAYTTFCL